MQHELARGAIGDEPVALLPALIGAIIGFTLTVVDGQAPRFFATASPATVRRANSDRNFPKLSAVLANSTTSTRRPSKTGQT